MEDLQSVALSSSPMQFPLTCAFTCVLVLLMQVKHSTSHPIEVCPLAYLRILDGV